MPLTWTVIHGNINTFFPSLFPHDSLYLCSVILTSKALATLSGCEKLLQRVRTLLGSSDGTRDPGLPFLATLGSATLLYGQRADSHTGHGRSFCQACLVSKLPPNCALPGTDLLAHHGYYW